MRPPRLAEYIAFLTVPARERAYVLGDLQEGFETIARQRTPRAARGWYWAQVIRSLPCNLVRGIRFDPVSRLRNGGSMLTGIVLDVRFAARNLRRSLGVSAVAILSLGFGIGALTTMFSIVDALDFRALPYHQPDRLMFIAEVTPASDARCPGCPASPARATADAWSTHSRAFEAFGLMAHTSLCIEEAGAIVCPDVGQASPGFFDVLGIRPALGRPFASEDTVAGAEPVAILSHETWMRRYGGTSDVLGARFEHADGSSLATRRARRIIGVMPRGFRFLRDYPVWLPLESTEQRSSPLTTVIARLKPDIRPAAAQAELQSLRAGLGTGSDLKAREVVVVPLRDRFGWSVGEGRGTLFGIAGIVLAVAVLNVAGLFAMRAAARRHELTTRLAIGASRLQLLRPLLVEGLVVGLLGGLLGVTLAAWGSGVASASFGLDSHGPLVQMDSRVVSFGLLLSALVGVIVAVIAGLGTGRIDPAAIRERTASASGQTGGRLSSVLVSAQIAAALILAAAGGILGSEYLTVRFFDIGYDPASVYETSITGPAAYRTLPELLRPDAARALETVRAIPGVLSASLRYRSAVHPAVVRTENDPILDESLSVEVVDASYFDTLSIAVVTGRAFSARDERGAPQVAIVNLATASKLGPDDSAIGQRIFFGDSATVGEWATVIGIVQDVERGEMVRRHHPRVYRPFGQAHLYHPTIQLHFRAAFGHADVARAVQTALRDTLGQPVRAVTSHESALDGEFLPERINALALNLFAGFALLLSAMGVYGSVAYAVTRRTREVGVRVALGADRAAILSLFGRHALLVGGAGMALGLAGSFVLTRTFRSFVSAIEANDPRVLVVATLLVALALLIATLVPARRAAGIDPAIALRGD
jgi:putative ABC transport system permease protein